MSRRASTKTRVLLVDDHGVVRMGSRSLIDLQADMSVVGEASTGAECLVWLEKSTADVIVADVRLPDTSGVDLCGEIRARYPSTRVVMLTAFADEAALAGSFRAGASAFILKNATGDGLISAIRLAHAGERFVDPATAEKIRSHLAGDPGRLMSKLSPQEKGVAHLVALGMTNREIAGEMGLAEKTVKNYVSNLLSKLGMSRRSQAAAYVAYSEAISPLSAGPESLADLESLLDRVSPGDSAGG